MSSKPLLDIGDKEWHIVEAILQRHMPDRDVWAFGSRAKWTAKEFSDLDVAILGEKSLTLDESAALSDAFADSDLPWKVDVVDWATTSSSFRKIIERDKVVVQTSRDSDFVRFGDLFGEPQRNGLTRPKRVRGAGLPMVNMGELFAYPRIKDIPMDLVPVEDKELQYLLETGDLLFARQSLVLSGAGQCSIFLGSNGSTVFESHLIRCRLNAQRSNPLFYFYYFRSPEGRRAIEAIVEQGAGASGIRGSDLVNVLVPNPPKKTQDDVAKFLGSLDDRITLFRETNATLEAIAQALFKSWFVDFDPVHAKMQGRAPDGMDEATAALFPDKFQESELGLIPKGWSAIPFRESINVIGGGTPKTTVAEFWGGDIPWFSVVDAPNSSDVFVLDTEKHITEVGLNGSSTKLLPVGTTIISARGTVGRLALTGAPMAMNQSCYGLRGKAGDQYFTYFGTTRLVQQLKQRAHGSVFDTITQETFAGVSLVYPNPDVITAFEALVDSLMLRVKKNLMQANSLEELRDTLLPRLVSARLHFLNERVA